MCVDLQPRWVIQFESEPSLGRHALRVSAAAGTRPQSQGVPAAARPAWGWPFSGRRPRQRKGPREGTRDPVGLRPAPTSLSQRAVSPRSAPLGRVRRSAACISHEPLRLSVFGREVTPARRRQLKHESAWPAAAGPGREAGLPLPRVTSSGGGSAAGAGRL